MRSKLVLAVLLLATVSAAGAQVSVGINVPGVRIGINIPSYPQLVPVPGYPVYYAPQLDSNYFFYDGLYWVYDGDNWYASSWYNGPWNYVDPSAVPLFVLRVPVRYYRRPPIYFRGWVGDAPPRWGEHWGGRWEQSHRGWDRWDRRAAPRPAPLPVYQRQYSGNRYPHVEQQRVLESRQYGYRPRDPEVRQHFDRVQGRPGPSERPGSPQGRGPGGRDDVRPGGPGGRGPGRDEARPHAPPQRSEPTELRRQSPGGGEGPGAVRPQSDNPGGEQPGRGRGPGGQSPDAPGNRGGGDHGGGDRGGGNGGGGEHGRR
jgi:hypothetical protein